MLAENPTDLTQFEQMIPLQRAGTAEEVPRLALFLAPEQSFYVTGGQVCIDGGAGP